MCSSTYNGQLLWVTVLDEWQAGILMVAGGRKDGWEERPRPQNPRWKIVWRQLISPHNNLCRHMQGFAAFIALCMECLVAMQGLHSNICSRLQGFTAFIALCMECLVAAQQYMRNICKWLQGCTAFIASCVECFGGNAVTAQQYMRVAAGLAQPLLNHAGKNLDCGLGDMATDHVMLCR